MKKPILISLFLLIVGAMMVLMGAYATVSQTPVAKMETLADRGGTVSQKSVVGCPVGATKASLASSGCGAAAQATLTSFGCGVASRKASMAYNSVLNGKTRLAAGESCCPAGGTRANETSKVVALKTSSN